MNDTFLFRNYGPAALDAPYNNRVAVPEHVELFEGWTEDSIRLLERFEHRLNVAYGSSKMEKLDIIMPPGDGLHPVNILFHGGYWMSRSKDGPDLCRPRPGRSRCSGSDCRLRPDATSAPRRDCSPMSSQRRLDTSQRGHFQR